MKKVIRVKQLDRSTTRYLLGWIMEDLLSFSEELGVVFHIGDWCFGKNNDSFQVKINVHNSKGESITKELESYYINALFYGLTPADLEEEFIYKGQPYKILGWDAKDHKCPVIARSHDGKKCKLTYRAVYEALGKEIPF